MDNITLLCKKRCGHGERLLSTNERPLCWVVRSTKIMSGIRRKGSVTLPHVVPVLSYVTRHQLRAIKKVTFYVSIPLTEAQRREHGAAISAHLHKVGQDILDAHRRRKAAEAEALARADVVEEEADATTTAGEQHHRFRCVSHGKSATDCLSTS